ncbi:MAG TPA: DUF1259 domain-containing protein [Gemmatimonadaceae bacterium]
MAIFCLCITSARAQTSTQPDAWSAVTAAIGRAGALQPDGVMKYSFPRSDMSVSLDGVTLKPALALGSWVAFKKLSDGNAMAMGDIVLAEAEVSPVISALQQRDVFQTAVHNHLLRESPRVVYVHIEARGAAAGIAAAIRTALDLTATPAPSPAAAGGSIDIDTATIHRLLGVAGKVNGGVYQVSVPRRETIRMGGDVVPPSMGVSTAINFQPTGNGRAAITGDFVMRGSEVNRVIPILRAGQITITALHSHMLGEEPRLYFMHFWANDDAGRLATTLRRALDQLKQKKGRFTQRPFLFERRLLLVLLVDECERVRLTNAVQHGVDRNCDAPIVQRGFFAGTALEPASHVWRRPSIARTSRTLFNRGGIRTIDVHSPSTGSVFLAIHTVPQNKGFEPLR